MPQYTLFLLEYGYRNKDEIAMDMAKNVLQSMYKGGIFDHIGYGFYRYSVDEKWLVPILKNALWQWVARHSLYKSLWVDKRPVYKEVVERYLNLYLENCSPKRIFYSALDAETEEKKESFMCLL